MKLLQIAPMLSPVGAFGGPVTVSVNQSAALLASGHQVLLAATTAGYSRIPKEFSGVPVQLFPARIIVPSLGYATLTAPESAFWLRKVMSQFDAVHVHLARDLFTLPLSRLALAWGVPVFVQPHGMIDPSERALSRPVDLSLTRPVLRRAERVFYLTDKEREGLIAVGGERIRLEQLNNGVPKSGAPMTPKKDARMEVIYVARLHARKRPLDFINMAIALTARHNDVDFTLIGPDEGEGEAVKAALLAAGSPRNINWIGPMSPSEVTSKLADAALYVQPSINETFPMSVLEAMSTGTPVVLRESCGLASAVTQSNSGITVGLDMPELISAVDDLLGNPERRAKMGHNARQCAEAQFSMTSIARQLEAAYEGAMSSDAS